MSAGATGPATNDTAPRADRPAPDVPALHGFRGLAILWIALGHCWWKAGGPPLDGGVGRDVFTNAYFGVDVLFVVSGFVLFLPAVVNTGGIGNLGSYTKRRFARIVPAYLVCLLVIIVFNHFLTGQRVPLPGTSSSGTAALLAHLLFVHEEVYGASIQNGFAVNGVLWTLSIEMVFYVLLPFVAAWYSRRPILGLGLAIVVAEVWQMGATHASVWLHWAGTSVPAPTSLRHLEEHLVLQFPTYAAHFAFGMTLAWIYVRATERGIGRIRTWLPGVQVAALGAFLWVSYAHGATDFAGRGGRFDHWVKTGDRMIMIGVLMLATALAPAWSQRPFASGWCRRLGDVSYGIYLFHLPLIGFALTTLGFAHGTNGDFLRMLLFVVPLSIACGYLSWRFVEGPARRWARRTSVTSAFGVFGPYTDGPSGEREGIVA